MNAVKQQPDEPKDVLHEVFFAALKIVLPDLQHEALFVSEGPLKAQTKKEIAGLIDFETGASGKQTSIQIWPDVDRELVKAFSGAIMAHTGHATTKRGKEITIAGSAKEIEEALDERKLFSSIRAHRLKS